MPQFLAPVRRAASRSVPAAAVAAVLGTLLTAAPASAAGPQAAGPQATTSAAVTRPVGIDVSRYQSSSTTTSCSGSVQVDWRQVRAAGRTFAFLKATGSRTTGSITKDPCFDRNWAGAGAAGLFRGAYHYAVPSGRSGSAVADARFFVATAGTMQDPGDLPPVLDLEATGGLTRGQVQAWATSWLTTVAALTGRQPILYTGPSFWRTFVAGGATFAGYPLWIAHYTRSAPAVPAPWGSWTFWQSSASGRVAGVSGPVDVDTFNGTAAQLSALGHPATVPTATPSSAVVYGGQPWSLTGVLRSAGGTPVRAATVTLYRRVAGSPSWTAVSSVRTDARNAAFRFDLRPTRAASYRVRYFGGRDFAASWSALRSHTFAVRVPTTLTSNSSAARVTKRAGVTLSGTLTLTPSRAGLTRTPVVLYRKVGAGPWTTWRSLTTSTGGRYRTTLHPVQTASYQLRYAGTVSRQPATSATRTVAVR